VDTDDDNDGVIDGTDAFALNPSGSVDTDGDGKPDELLDTYLLKWFNTTNLLIEDLDDDNDGIIDTEDAFALNPSEWADNDGDRIGDNADADDDNDEYSDETEKQAGTDPFDVLDIPNDNDADGMLDYIDADIDNDGYNNDLELSQGSDPYNSSSRPADLDVDYIPDSVDSDDDNDGYSDVLDAFPVNPSGAIDSDGDGKPDRLLDTSYHPWFKLSDELLEDDDDDDDGVPDSEDAFRLNPAESKDSDWDGIGDNADDDADNDGLKKEERFFFFFDYSDTNDGDPDAGWLIKGKLPLSTILSFFQLVGGLMVLYMIGAIFQKVRFLRFDKKLHKAKSIEELDRWYHNQISLAIEHGKIDYRGSKQLKAAYETEKMKLLSGERKKASFLTRLRKAFVFSNNDFKELIELDKTYEDEDEYDDDDEETKDNDVGDDADWGEADTEEDDDNEENDEDGEGSNTDETAGPSLEHVGPVVEKETKTQKGLLYCQSCAAIVRENDVFCMECGMSLKKEVEMGNILKDVKKEVPELPSPQEIDKQK